MNNPMNLIVCPDCGFSQVSLLDYTSLLVVKPGLGLFTISCPNCSSKITTMQAIPESLEKEVQEAALLAGAGMGKDIQ